MRSGWRRGTPLLGTAAILTSLLVSPPAQATPTPTPWKGRYQMLTYASQKAGTSPASRQAENDFSAVFTLSTSCTVKTCVASIVDGPRPDNQTVPWPPRVTWNGAEWTTSYDWLWDCLAGSGQKQWAHATSWTFYKPESDGSLKGSWHTDIAEGACRGNVVMPVAAVPA